MQADFISTNLAKNLPDSYKKTKDSNNFKILEIERIACNDLRKYLWGYYLCKKCGDTIPFGEQVCPICGEKGERVNSGVYDILDINNATGKTLDLYGERVGQARGLADDSKYLLMIKAKIMRNISNGSYTSIINSLCMTFDCDPSQIIIVETEKPCTIEIVSLPLSVINGAGLTASQTLAIIKSLLPIGVSIESYLFDGTFEFSDSENEYDESTGFCDVEGGTIGGYLGITQGDAGETILPI